MKILGFIGFGMGVVALVLALFNFYELLPFADSIAHLDADPYYTLWERAMRLTKNVATISVIVGGIAALLSTVYFFLERRKLYIYGTGFSVLAILFSLPLFY